MGSKNAFSAQHRLFEELLPKLVVIFTMCDRLI